jgi:signal transduction histidine kinase
MKWYVLIFCLFLTSFVFSQNIKKQTSDGVWDQGVPILPDDKYVMGLINELGDSLRDWDYVTTKSKAKVCREIGLVFYDRGLYDAADWYLTKSKNYREEAVIEKTEPKLKENEKQLLESDKKIVEKLVPTFDKLSKNDLKDILKEVENKMQQLIRERDSLIRVNAPQVLIDSKNSTIKTLEKERNFIGLSMEKMDLQDENVQIRNYLFWAILSIALLITILIVIAQRKTIRVKDGEIINQLIELNKKNSYLEHAAKLIRHDMHSGINTYIPKGISTLERRITSEDIQKLNLELPLKMIKDGLTHTQKVYKNVYEFTNLVKQNVVLEKTKVDLKEILTKYLSNTSYVSQVKIDDLFEMEVNETLFCIAVDNLIKNGLKYNDNEIKEIKIYLVNGELIIEDNGRGLTEKEFDKIVNKHTKEIDKNGLGISICLTILQKHGFDLTCEKIDTGTKMKINFKKN